MIKILYINLDQRTDRKEHMEELLKDSNYERISAIEDEKGYIGCVKSHIYCLELAKERDYDEVIILEDDFIFKKENNFENMKYPNFNYDVLLICNLIKKRKHINEYFDKAESAEWTSGHLVKKHFYQILIDNFKESLSLLQKDYIRDHYLDVYLKKLMKDYSFVTHKNSIATQKDGYSDIAKKSIKRQNHI